MGYEPDSDDDFSEICEFLGLADDADSHATYATEAHRCYHMASPTRIALPHQENYCLGPNHVSCPVFRVEGAGVSRAAGAAAASHTQAPVRPAASRPLPSERPPARERQLRPETAPAGRQARPRPPGSVGPRPRAGGPGIPAMTIGLFLLAIVVIGIAIFINNAVGNDNGDDQTSGIISGLDRTRTAQALAGTQQTPTQPPARQTQAAQTRAATTPATSAATTTGAAGTTTGTAPAGRTYTVKSGDTCSGIATANNTTLAQLLAANNMVEADCPSLQVGRVLNLP